MKKSLIALALLASFGVVHAQSAQSGSLSSSGAAAGATSGSSSGASSGSNAVIYLDMSAPATQTLNQNVKNTGTLTTTATENVNYSGKIENVQSGTTTQILHTSGGTTDTNNVNYSGTQTVKNVPGIAMSGPASGPCTGASGGLGIAGPGFGLGINGAKVEPSCVLRENIRVTGMAMQSLDGAAHPQEKGALLVMMMDQMKGLALMSAQIIEENVKAKAK